MRQKRACCTMPPPLWTPPTAQISFEIRTSLYCILVLAQWPPPPLTPPVVQQPGCIPALRKFHLKFAQWPPPWTPPTAQDPCSPILTRSCRMRKIHGHPLRKIHVPPHCARSMSSHCAISMSPNYGRSMSPLETCPVYFKIDGSWPLQSASNWEGKNTEHNYLPWN